MLLAALLALPALALLLLAAHLAHAGLMPLAALAILLVGLLAVPRPWASRTLQVILAVAVIEWILSTVGIAQLRLRHGEPYLRLAAILGSVSVLTALAALVFRHPVLRAYFRLPAKSAAEPAAR